MSGDERQRDGKPMLAWLVEGAVEPGLAWDADMLPRVVAGPITWPYQKTLEVLRPCDDAYVVMTVGQTITHVATNRLRCLCTGNYVDLA